MDSGSTHSFVVATLAKKLDLITEKITPLMVTMADGSQTVVDTVCKQLGYTIQGNFFTSELVLFSLGGSEVVLGVYWL